MVRDNAGAGVATDAVIWDEDIDLRLQTSALAANSSTNFLELRSSFLGRRTSTVRIWSPRSLGLWGVGAPFLANLRRCVVHIGGVPTVNTTAMPILLAVAAAFFCVMQP